MQWGLTRPQTEQTAHWFVASLRGCQVKRGGEGEGNGSGMGSGSGSVEGSD